MDIIARDGADLMREEAAFATPDSIRDEPLRCTDQIEAFQRCVAALDQWPLDDPIDGFSLRMITTHAEHDAQTGYLRRLANF